MRSLSWSRPSGAGSPVGVTPPHHVFKETRMCFPPQHMVEAHPGGICGRLNNGVHSLLAAGSCPSSCVTCCRRAGSMRASVRRCVPLREPGHGRRSAVHGLTKGGTIRLREPADNPLLGNHQGTGGCTSSVCKVIAGGIKFHPPPKGVMSTGGGQLARLLQITTRQERGSWPGDGWIHGIHIVHRA